MAADPTKARQLLTQVRLNVKQNKVLPAVQGVHDALIIVMKSNLMKAEREEFEKLIMEACQSLNKNDDIARSVGMQLSFSLGQEKELLDNLVLMLTALNQDIAEKMKGKIVEDSGNKKALDDMARKKQETRKKELLKNIDSSILAGNLEDAHNVVLEAIQELGNSPDFLASIGRLYFQHYLYKPAADYLCGAIEGDPQMLWVYNDLGIALRKMKRFAEAESYYLKASKYMPADSHLFFNLGRVYLDWEDWQRAIQVAKAALKLDPEFEEAQKMLTYAQKKIEAQTEQSSEN